VKSLADAICMSETHPGNHMIRLGIPRAKNGRKTLVKPPKFEGESSYVPGKRDIRRRISADREQEKHYSPLRSALFSVGADGEVVVDRINEVLGW